ncbi:MAG: RNA polymerase sigma factor [Chitinophagaceae bacterium]
MAFLINISSHESDIDLIQQYRQTSDLKLIGELYQRYMDLVYGVCLKYLKDPEDAKDAVLNIFEELVTKLQKHEVENFKSWLYQLTKNHCLMRLRSEKHRNVKLDPALMQSEENVHLNGELEKEENFKQLQYCLQQLTTEQRHVIELFYLQGKCYNEIAETTGIEWNKVRSFIQNGRRNLKNCMEKKGVSLKAEGKG